MADGVEVPADAVLPMIGEEGRNALDAGLQKAGVFCSICGRPAPEQQEPPKLGDLKPGEGAMWTEGESPTMMEFLIIEPRIVGSEMKATINLRRVYWCRRDDCDASGVEQRAHAARIVPAWTLFASPEEEAEAEEKS